MATETTVSQLVSVQIVANAFVQQYYHILHYSPDLVHRFYHDVSKLGRPEEDGSLSITTTLQGINQKIVSLNYGDFRAEIKSVDSQESFNGGVHVIVTGNLTGKDNVVSNFAQTFFLAPQEKGYFVLNDMFRYIDNSNVNVGVVINVVLPTTPEPVSAPQVLENHVPDKSVPSVEDVAEEVYNPPENVDSPVVAIVDEVFEAKIVEEVYDDPQLAIKSAVKAEEGPKKSYASIVMVPKGNISTFSPPPAALKKAPLKKVEQVSPDILPAINVPLSSIESVDGGNNQEVDGYSIYLKGLPMNATEGLLEEVFMKFGAIKNNGIQVRSNRQQGFCFGFVEFEEASSLQKALEASPLAVGARQVIVEEKRSTGSRGNNRGRFQQPGRGSGFKNEGSKGRGNYAGGSGRGYNNRAGDFNGRSEFGNNRTGSSNRMNRTGGNGITNGSARNVAPQISATA